jgi:hypothetical protein
VNGPSSFNSQRSIGNGQGAAPVSAEVPEPPAQKSQRTIYQSKLATSSDDTQNKSHRSAKSSSSTMTAAAAKAAQNRPLWSGGDQGHVPGMPLSSPDRKKKKSSRRHGGAAVGEGLENAFPEEVLGSVALSENGSFAGPMGAQSPYGGHTGPIQSGALLLFELHV